MFKRTRYQHGCLTREGRRREPDVWIFRWRDFGPSGNRRNRKLVIGTVEEYRTESAAWKAVEALHLDINKETPRSVQGSVTVEQLVAHYKAKELGEGNTRKAFSTRAAYQCYLDNWILPRWKLYLLAEVKAVAVEEWLGSLSLTNGSRAKIRNIMSALFTHAMRYEWLERNPIMLVRQSGKRERIPDVLEAHKLASLLSNLQQPYRSMAFLAAVTGLRVSELLALKWCDIDFEGSQIFLERGIVQQVVGKLKTEASRKPVPLDLELANELKSWKSKSKYNTPEDWVFASHATSGKQPYWPEGLLRRHIRPVAKACKIQKNVGWHTFRRSYATLLKANGEDVKVVQEALRHANSRITLDTYAQALTSAKRQAQSKVVQMILPKQQADVGMAAEA